MLALTILSHPICHMALAFLFTMGVFEYGVATLKTPNAGWRKTAVFFCCFNSIAFYLLEYFILGYYPPSLAIFICAIVLVPQMYFVAKDSAYNFFYLIISLIFVMLMSYNLAVLLVRWLNIVRPGELNINATVAIASITYIFASLYLYFDTRMPFIKLENFNHLMHNPRGRYLLYYFFLFDAVMSFSILFIRRLLFFDTVPENTLFNLLVLMTLLNVLILVSSFLIVLFMCRLDSSARKIEMAYKQE